MKKCYRCGGKLEDRVVMLDDVILGQPIQLSNVPAKVCVECGERLIPGIVLEKLEDYVARQLGRDEAAAACEHDRSYRISTLRYTKDKECVIV